MPFNVAVDGPAGVGKSTVGKLLADRHGYLFLDTGVLYRAVSLLALRRSVSPSDPQGLAAIACTLDIELLRAEPGSKHMYEVIVEGRVVTDELRSGDVESLVSEVSAHSEVRTALLERQRDIARASRSVIVGRDIGTVVLPDADLKVYLDASLEERADRRWKELQQRGAPVVYEQVVAELRRRDELDSGRETAPLRVPADARVINTNGKDVEMVLAEIEASMGAG